MPVLTLKLVRDLWKARWQYLAVALMVILGIMFFNGAYAAYVNLDSSYANSYRRLSFEDFGVTFNTAPERTADRIQKIPGVKAVEGRLVEDVILELTGKTTKKLIGRLIGVPPDRPMKVDALKIVQGHYISGKTDREIMLEASFAKYHKLKPGDFVEAVRGASRAKFRIAAIVQSAEYLYVVRSKQELMALPDTFGVMFVSKDVLGPLVGKTGQINEVRVTVNDPERIGPIMRRAKEALAAYRPDDPVERKDQPSFQMLQSDVKGFQAYAVLFPAFFLSVAAMTVYTLLMRMVHQQRPIIGLLRSLGHGTATVVTHYLGAALLIGVLGSAIGTVLGQAMAGWVSRLYMGELQVPYEDVSPRVSVLIAGFIIGTLTCTVAGYFPARMAARIRPAEAMRPVTPTFGRRSLQLDRMLPGVRLLWRIPLRNIFRQPRRTLSTLFGIVAGVALMMTARGLLDSTTVAIDQMIGGAYKYDLRLDFLRYQSHSVVNRVRSWPGVVWAEGSLDVPVDMKHGSATYSGLVSGQEPDAKLHTLVDAGGLPVNPTSSGAVFGPTLRKRLNLEVGDLVEFRIPEDVTKERPTLRLVRVTGFNEEAIGTVAYMRFNDLNRLFRTDLELPPNAIGSVLVMAKPEYLGQTRQRLLAVTDAASVSSIPELRTLIEGQLKTLRIFVWIMELFGAALALAMVFNMVTINVLERSAEVATLRTIGVSRREVGTAIALETLVIAVIGAFAGLPAGLAVVKGFWAASQTPEQQDLFTFNVVILPETYVISAVAIVVVAMISQIPALIHVGRMDLAKATKERAT